MILKKKSENLPGSLSNSVFDSNCSFYYLGQNGIEHYSIFNQVKPVVKIPYELSLLITFFDQKLWYIENRTNFCSFDITNHSVNKFNFGKYSGMNKNGIALFYSKVLDKNIISVFDLKENKKLYDVINPIALQFFGSYLISGSDGFYKLYDIYSGKIIWSKNFNFNNQVISTFRFIGEYQNILVVGIGEDKLTGINVENGVVVWECETVPEKTILNQETGVITTFAVNYASFNALNGELLDNYNNSEYFREVGIETQRGNYVHDEEYIYTTDMSKGIIGAFNTHTHQFDWIYEEEGVYFPAGSPMVYHEPYLFVQDQNNTLHIFEKETPQLS